NVRFTFMVGERDTAYGRAERCQAFAGEVEGWREQLGGFPGGFEWLPGVGHSVPDRDKVAELLEARREPWPDRLVWVQSDDVLRDFYWIEDEAPADGRRLEVSTSDNAIAVVCDDS